MKNRAEKIVYFILLVIVAISVITITTIGKYYEVKQYKKSIENLKLEHEILIKKKELLKNEKSCLKTCVINKSLLPL